MYFKEIRNSSNIFGCINQKNEELYTQIYQIDYIFNGLSLIRDDYYLPSITLS